MDSQCFVLTNVEVGRGDGHMLKRRAIGGHHFAGDHTFRREFEDHRV